MVVGILFVGGCGSLERLAPVPASDPTADTATGPILSTTAGVYDVSISVSTNSCPQPDVAEVFGAVELKFDQAADGLSVFVDPDMGWIPCEGAVDAFTCRWGNAPSDVPGTWSWSLGGTSDGRTVRATLALSVTCAGESGCQECSAVGQIEGTIR